MASRVLAPAEAPPEVERRAVPPALGQAYVIDGRPFFCFPSMEDAIEEAESLVRRLRLTMTVKVRIAGTETVVATVCADDAGIVVLVL